MNDDYIPYDQKKQEMCKHKNTKVINYDPIWRDGDVICEDCGKHIRTYDAG